MKGVTGAPTEAFLFRSRPLSPAWQERRGPNPHFRESFLRKSKNQKHDLVINKKYWRRRAVAQALAWQGGRGLGTPSPCPGVGPPSAWKGNRGSAFSFQASLSIPDSRSKTTGFSIPSPEEGRKRGPI